MSNFSDSNVWSILLLIAILCASLILANIIKKNIPFLKNSLIPTSVLGGLIILVVATIYYAITKNFLFEEDVFSIVLNTEKMTGSDFLEIITYHCLALGFIAMTLKDSKKKFTKYRSFEIFNTGVTTVAGYLIQAIVGIAITVLAYVLVTDTIPAFSGALLPFGYGQGTGQAMNYGNIYEQDHGFIGGKSFGLAVAAMGFLSASIGGVIYLNVLKKKGKIVVDENKIYNALNNEKVECDDEIPMNGSMDKITYQIATIICVYIITYAIMFGLAKLAPGLSSIFYGFNFLFGVLVATLVKQIINFLRRKNIIKKRYINSFLMNRISNFCFDMMIVAGIAAIKINVLKEYWLILLILGLAGAFVTFYYIRFICKKCFGDYWIPQFFVMYGMLTGTASTGVILLREVDNEFESPASENLIYQNLPAIVFGFPMMLVGAYVATNGLKSSLITLALVIVYFAVLNVILFVSHNWSKKFKENDNNEIKES